MIIKNFYTDGGEFVVDVEALNTPPIDVTFTDSSGNVVVTTVPVAQVGDVYSYRASKVDQFGIFRVVITHLVDDAVEAAIGDITPLVTYLAHLVLNDKFDCLFLQELYAIEKYLRSKKHANASAIYIRAYKKSRVCTIDYSPELVYTRYFIYNEILTEV